MEILYSALRGILFRASLILRVFAVRFAYARTLCAVRRRVKIHKIKVLFPINEVAKWKVQSVVDYMRESGRYEVVIAVTIADVDWRLSSDEQVSKLRQTKEFFEKRGMIVMDAYDLKTRMAVPFSRFDPDIVFYNQPWGYVECQMPAAVSIYALTVYVPYFVLNYGDGVNDVTHQFHRQLWLHILLSPQWASEYRKLISIFTHSGRLLGLGHPQLDYYYLNRSKFEDGNLVVYAPHWSISCEGYSNFENYSTFLWTGQYILSYAKLHPEFEWVFKPHPSLKIALYDSGAWTREQVDQYWDEWARVGKVCQTNEYTALFVKSKAMITDCGSFLPEYFATGKPLIHLISSTCKISPAPSAKLYFDTFYQVHNEAEMRDVFERVLERSDDYRKDERLSMLQKIGLNGNYAAKNIVDYLEKELAR